MAELAKHKVPRLRNVDLRPSVVFVKAYAHNAHFGSLAEIVHFYNARDRDPMWPDPEVAMNVNTAESGDLRLKPNQEAAIVAFMKTLSDGWMSRTAAAH